MDWDDIIERNAERLVAVITELFVMAGFGRGGTAKLPRHVCRALLILLHPCESAVRRLIIIAARVGREASGHRRIARLSGGTGLETGRGARCRILPD